jgi:FG-GAP-like repeat
MMAILHRWLVRLIMLSAAAAAVLMSGGPAAADSGDGGACPGLPLCTPLDRTSRVEFSLDELRAAPPVAQWAQVGFCDGSQAPVDPNFPSFVFYPQLAPCHITINDLAGQLYEFDITGLPSDMGTTAVGNCLFPRLQTIWCASVGVNKDPSLAPYYNYITVGATTPGPVPSTHAFNGSGYSDLLWIDTHSGNASVWLNQPGVPVAQGGIGNLSGYVSVGQRDFDRDGKADVLWQSTDGRGEVILWMMNGASIVPFEPVIPPATVPSAYQMWDMGSFPTFSVVGTGDFQGSGLGGILWKDNSDNYAMWIVDGASRQVIASGALGNLPSSQWRVAGTADFDGDGAYDILWQSPAGDLAIWFMQGIGIKSVAGVGNVGPSWIVVGTGDFNGDGEGDILFRYNTPNNAGDPNNGTVAIWLMNRAQQASSGSFGVISTNWSAVLTGDYNRDGKSDIVWYYNNLSNPNDPSNGTTSLWFMNGLMIASTGSLGIIPTNFQIQTANAE